MSATVPLCSICGRGVVNGVGLSGTFYHPQCVSAPQPAAPMGCICPPGSERTCANGLCPRKAVAPARSQAEPPA